MERSSRTFGIQFVCVFVWNEPCPLKTSRNNQFVRANDDDDPKSKQLHTIGMQQLVLFHSAKPIISMVFFCFIWVSAEWLRQHHRFSSSTFFSFNVNNAAILSLHTRFKSQRERFQWGIEHIRMKQERNEVSKQMKLHSLNSANANRTQFKN